MIPYMKSIHDNMHDFTNLKHSYKVFCIARCAYNYMVVFPNPSIVKIIDGHPNKNFLLFLMHSPYFFNVNMHIQSFQGRHTTILSN